MLITNLEDKYILARYMYAIANPIIDDAEYDRLHEYMLSNNLLREYTTLSWRGDSIPINLVHKYVLSAPIVDSPYVERVETSSMESITKENDILKLFPNSYHVSLKYDGWNCQAIYSKGLLSSVESRARVNKPILINGYQLDLPQRISLVEEIIVVGELLLSYSNFEILQQRIGKKLVSPRTSVRTALSTDNHDLLTFIAFSVWVNKNLINIHESQEFLLNHNFNISEFTSIVNDYDSLLSTVDSLQFFKINGAYPTDGVVIRNIHTNEYHALRIMAWAQNQLSSFVLRYEDSYAPLYITPIAIIHPVTLEQSIQRKVSVTNVAHIVNYNLREGAPIAFKHVSSAYGALDVTTTQILHKEWMNRWNDYQDCIKRGECVLSSG